MHFVVMIIFVLVWLLIVWIGSVALERTGLDRSSARFQALSAFSGTGFTTSQAEIVVNHPVRRRIVSILMLLGNMGSVTIIVLLVLAVQSGLYRLAIALGILAGGLAAVGFVASKLGLGERITNVVTGRGRTMWKIWHQGGGYILAEVRLGRRHSLIGKALKEIGPGTQVLFLESRDGGWAKPNPDDILRVGDRFLLYGPSESLQLSDTG